MLPSSHPSPSLVYVAGFYLQWFRRGLVIEADRLFNYSNLGVKDTFLRVSVVALLPVPI